MLARSNHVFAGYWEQPEETAKALDGGWFHTGDKGHVEAGEYLVISDRKKDVIISGGENVSSVEVEDCLYQHPAVAEVAVIGVPDAKWGETVKALVVLRSADGATEAELIEHCRSRLSHFKCPTSVELGTRCRGPLPASCRSSSCASRTGRASTARSTRTRSALVLARPCDDLLDDGGLGVGVVLHVPPGALREVTLQCQVGVAVLVVSTQPVTKQQHPVDLGRRRRRKRAG